MLQLCHYRLILPYQCLLNLFDVFFALGNADELVNESNSNSKKSLLSNWRMKKSLNLLNITYDVTPADLVTAVVTELAILPCTSVPVILRIKPSEI